MRHGDAEAERPHRPGVRDLVAHDLPGEHHQLLDGLGEALVVLGDPVEQVVDEGHPLRLGRAGQQGPFDGGGDVAGEDLRLVGLLHVGPMRHRLGDARQLDLQPRRAQPFVHALVQHTAPYPRPPAHPSRSARRPRYRVTSEGRRALRYRPVPWGG
ncbi:hypothetical protein ACL02T_30970 [Pseudonocardia sp. RS010]|uniref:hypothetical protein n=1 Tax=Pseudonocardia sp. RS010 TaxID=3385979 RepID=UPI0039A27491